MKTKEFFEYELNNIIDELSEFWTVQGQGKDRYVNCPLPTKEDFLEKYECALDEPIEELTDIEDYSEQEQEQMIERYKKDISEEYDRIKRARDEFNS